MISNSIISIYIIPNLVCWIAYLVFYPIWTEYRIAFVTTCFSVFTFRIAEPIIYFQKYISRACRSRRSDWYRETCRDASFIAFRASFSGRRLREKVRFLGKSNIVLIYLPTSRRRMETRNNAQKIAVFKDLQNSRRNLFTRNSRIYSYVRAHTQIGYDIYFWDWFIKVI